MIFFQIWYFESNDSSQGFEKLTRVDFFFLNELYNFLFLLGYSNIIIWAVDMAGYLRLTQP